VAAAWLVTTPPVAKAIQASKANLFEDCGLNVTFRSFHQVAVVL
jgi:hypothetical protein